MGNRTGRGAVRLRKKGTCDQTRPEAKGGQFEFDGGCRKIQQPKEVKQLVRFEAARPRLGTDARPSIKKEPRSVSKKLGTGLDRLGRGGTPPKRDAARPVIHAKVRAHGTGPERALVQSVEILCPV